MDLNPDVHKQAARRASPYSSRIAHSLGRCRKARWTLCSPAIFWSICRTKSAVSAVLSHAYRCLKPGGHLIAMGPNIKYVPGAYWDFFDHYVPLTELSLAEGAVAMRLRDRNTDGRFLPYTMAHGATGTRSGCCGCIWLCRSSGRIFGKQFLVVGRKPGNACTRHRPIFVAASVLLLAGCAKPPAKPVEDLGGGQNVSQFKLTSLRGTRNGDRLNVRATVGDGLRPDRSRAFTSE